MKILIFLSVLFSTLCKTVPINDITFNEKYSASPAGVPVPAGSEYLFRMRILENDKMQVSLTTYDSFSYYTYHYSHIDFIVKYALFKGVPTLEDYQIQNFKDLEWDSESYDGDWISINYPFDTEEGKDYLGIYLYVKTGIYYLEITVLSVTGLIWVFILVGAVVFIGAVVGAILGVRKYRR